MGAIEDYTNYLARATNGPNVDPNESMPYRIGARTKNLVTGVANEIAGAVNQGVKPTVEGAKLAVGGAYDIGRGILGLNANAAPETDTALQTPTLPTTPAAAPTTALPQSPQAVSRTPAASMTDVAAPGLISRYSGGQPGGNGTTVMRGLDISQVGGNAIANAYRGPELPSPYAQRPDGTWINTMHGNDETVVSPGYPYVMTEGQRQDRAIQSYLEGLRQTQVLDASYAKDMISMLPHASPGRMAEAIASISGQRTSPAPLGGVLGEYSGDRRYTADQEVKIANIRAMVEQMAQQEETRRAQMNANATITAAGMRGSGGSGEAYAPRLTTMKKPIMGLEGYQVGEEEVPVAYQDGRWYTYDGSTSPAGGSSELRNTYTHPSGRVVSRSEIEETAANRGMSPQEVINRLGLK